MRISERKRKMDDKTFGFSRAAINLVDILNSSTDLLMKQKARRLLGHQLQRLSSFSLVEDPKIRKYALSLCHDAFKKEIKKNSKIPEFVLSHISSVETAKYREIKNSY